MKISCFVDGDKPLPRYTRYRVAHGVFDVSSAKSCKSFLYLSESRGQASAAFSCDISLLCSTLRRGIILYDDRHRLI